MSSKKKLMVAGGLVAVLGVLWACQTELQRMADAQSVQAPGFQVDPFWPKPLPNNWVLGSTIGLWVDDQDLVWIVHRPETLADNERSLDVEPRTSQYCCSAAPPVMAFDAEGNVVHAWGYDAGFEGDGFVWPASNHGIFVDHEGYVWIGGNGGPDAHVLKFTQTGEFVAQYGESGAREVGGEFVRDSHSATSFGRVAKIFVDAEENEAFLADGYFNRRVAVLDASTGELKRYWGAYGNEPDDDPGYFADLERGANDQFRGPVHCADVSHDRLVYVCDRGNNRLQVFTMDGEFVDEAFYSPETLGEGSTWDIAFSRDPEQRYIYLADGRNQRVRVVHRESLEELTSFGRGGRYPGHFFSLHSIATDSQGNVFTTETYQGRRLQKFVYMGESEVSVDQGATYPDS
jgi:hypothetical protein